MSRKSGIGKSSGDNFNKAAKKIPRLGDYPQSNRFSFRMPEISTPISGECEGHNVEQVNLDLSPLGGRLKLYDPVQVKNYESIYNRYSKATELIISATQKVGNKTIYKFRSCNSSTGFWTVEVGGNGTYVRLDNPILTIICPRPFTASELIGIHTDSDTLLWTQTQGRITIISPSSGERSLDPTFAIIGNKSPTDPPIFIRVELPDDPTIFDVLVIDTTATSRFYNIGYANNALVEDSQFKVPCSTSVYVPPPGGIGISQAIELNPLRRTWNLPPNSDGLINTIWQLNSTGTYNNVQIFPVASIRDFTVLLETHYRIAANFNYQGNSFSSRSCTFYYVDAGNIKTLAADDQWIGSISYGSTIGDGSTNSYQVTPFSVKTVPETDYWIGSISYGSTIGDGSTNSYQVTPFSVKTVPETDYWVGSISYGSSISRYQTDSLGGVVIG